MAFAGGAMLLWARRKPALAGVLLGLATAAKLYPILFLIPLFLLCLRARRLRAFAVTTGTTLLAIAAVTVPVYLVSPYYYDDQQTHTLPQVAASPLDRLHDDGLAALSPQVVATLSDGRVVKGDNAVYRFFNLNQLRQADWDSLWFALQTKRGQPLDTNLKPDEPPHKLNRGVAVSFALLLGGIGALVFLAPRRPRLPQVLFLTMVAFLLTNKVFSPQYAIWLLPLAVLARPRWRPFLVWQATEVLVLFTRFYFFVGNDKPGQGIGTWWFLTAVLLRDLALVGYSALVVRDILHPEHDPVRQVGQDDPAGGVLEDDVGDGTANDAADGRLQPALAG
jgi:uncharacterized membrane protein